MKKRNFQMAPGQYILIQCPSISRLEWHPFTLTSAPQENFFSVHIRVAGDWTEALCQAFGAEGQASKELWSLPRQEPVSFLHITQNSITRQYLYSRWQILIYFFKFKDLYKEDNLVDFQQKQVHFFKKKKNQNVRQRQAAIQEEGALCFLSSKTTLG